MGEGRWDSQQGAMGAAGQVQDLQGKPRAETPRQELALLGGRDVLQLRNLGPALVGDIGRVGPTGLPRVTFNLHLASSDQRPRPPLRKAWEPHRDGRVTEKPGSVDWLSEHVPRAHSVLLL